MTTVYSFFESPGVGLGWVTSEAGLGRGGLGLRTIRGFSTIGCGFSGLGPVAVGPALWVGYPRASKRLSNVTAAGE